MICSPLTVRLQGFYWPSDDYLMINVSTFQSLQTVDGQRDYNFLQAPSYDIDDNERAVISRVARAGAA